MTNPTSSAVSAGGVPPPAFLLELSDALRPLTDPAAVQGTAARVLGERLGADRAYYVAVDEERAEYVVEREWHRSGAPSHARQYPLAAWPMPWLADGRPWVVTDVDVDPALPDDQRAAYRGNDIGACVVVPLVRGGRLVATLVANQRVPRAWTSDEVAMVEATAARTWAAVEQARAHGERERQRDAALQASEARFRAVQDASPYGLVLLRPERERAPDGGADGAGRIVDFRIQYANPAGARLAGRRVDAMVGHTLLELFPATRPLGLFDAYVGVIETGDPWEDDVRYVGDGLAAGYQLAAVRVGEGAAAELALLYADATARLAAEIERGRLLAELGAERERLRTVILQTPAPLALLEGPEHRFTLVNAAYKRINGDRRDVTGLTPREAFPELAGSGIYEALDCVLLGNAVKFTHAHGGVPGRVEVACSTEEGIGLVAAGGHVDGRMRLHVRDTGQGIAADALERIFEPFVQADQRLTRPHAGVGLGLAISRDLVVRHPNVGQGRLPSSLRGRVMTDPTRWLKVAGLFMRFAAFGQVGHERFDIPGTYRARTRSARRGATSTRCLRARRGPLGREGDHLAVVGAQKVLDYA